MKITLLFNLMFAAILGVRSSCAAESAPMKFKRVYAFTGIGDDAYAAKLAELNVYAAECNVKKDPGSIARAKKYGIVPCVSFGPFRCTHGQVITPEEAYRQYELNGEFLPDGLKGEERDAARRELWRKDGYRMGGEPLPGNSEVLMDGIACFVGEKARTKSAAELVKKLKANPEAKAVSLDYIGYVNYRCCHHPECEHLYRQWLKARTLENNAANRDRFFEDQIVEYYAALYDAVKAYDPSVVVYAHLYPVFLPNPLYGNRLKLDACCQTCAWYFRWPQEKVKTYCETVVRGQRDHWDFAHCAPFVACGKWVKEIDPAYHKTPADYDRELRTALEAGAEYLGVHEISAVIADPEIFAVFRKYCKGNTK